MTLDQVEKYIQEITDNIRKESVIQTTAIRDGIFAILEKKCTVVYYPLDNETNRGFHIKRYVGGRQEAFVYITTANPLAEQIFAAAHEFGHICEVAEKVWKNLKATGNMTTEDEEEITNWFAAELLMPYDTFRESFRSHMSDLGIEPGPVSLNNLTRMIVLVMNDFMVPYESVRRRLVETHLLDKKSADWLLSQDDQVKERIDFYTKDRNTVIDTHTGSRTISGIRTLINKAEKSTTADPYIINKIKAEFGMQEASDSGDMHISIEDSGDE